MIALDQDAAVDGRWMGAFATAHPPVSLALRGASLQVRSAARAIETLASADIALDWPGPHAPAALTAAGSARGERFDATAWVDAPEAWLRGEPAMIALDLRSKALSAHAQGAATLRGALAFRGAVHASSGDAASLAKVCADLCPTPAPNLARFAFSADVNASPVAAAMSRLRLHVNDMALEGAASLRREAGRLLVAGTLAADHLRLPRDIVDQLATPIRADLPAPDLDLRFSAGRLDFGPARLEEAAFSVLRRKGALWLDLAEAGAFGGALRANAQIEAFGPGLRVTAQAKGRNLSADALCAMAQCPFALTGRAQAEISATGVGAQLGEALTRMNGDAQVDLARGMFTGLDLEQALRRLEKRPLAAGFELRPGRIAYDQAGLRLRLEPNAAIVTKGLMIGPATRIALDGDVSLNDGALRLSGRAEQSGDNGAARAGGPQLDFSIEGQWRAPVFRSLGATERP